MAYVYIILTYIWLLWLPDLCKLIQNEAVREFFLSPSELMSGGYWSMWLTPQNEIQNNL